MPKIIIMILPKYIEKIDKQLGFYDYDHHKNQLKRTLESKHLQN